MTCTSQVELSLSAANLINMDLFSKSDPFCIVFTKEPWQDRFFEYARSETIDDCLSPAWVKKFVFEYRFETVQRLRFEVWDEDLGGTRDFLGAHETTLAEIVSYAASSAYTRPLDGPSGRDGTARGTLTIIAEELSLCKQSVVLKFAAKNLAKKWFGWVHPRPFLEISRANEGTSTPTVVARTVAGNSSEFVWPSLNLSVRSLCNGDHDRALKIDVLDWAHSGSHKLLGTVHTSLRVLLDGAIAQQPFSGDVSRLGSGANLLSKSNAPKSFPLVSDKKARAAAATKQSLVLREISLLQEFTFLDYIASGMQLHFALAIDFTASNGPFHDPKSLHFLDPRHDGRQNAYELALRAVGTIVAQYDTTGLYPAFGFGAKLADGQTHHQFPLNGNAAHPYCASIEEIVGHYRRTAASVTFHGPTNFAPVIGNTAEIASKFARGKDYFILLIITDGIISDMHQTMRAIVRASHQPLSIIIVGVGQADFAAMDELDSDDHLLRVDGEAAQRDIVQFVPLRQFLSPNTPGIQSQTDLAREVLAEIPDQVTGFMKSRGFWPTTSRP